MPESASQRTCVYLRCERLSEGAYVRGLVDARDLLDDPGGHQHENEDDGAESEPPAALLSGKGFFRSHTNS